MTYPVPLKSYFTCGHLIAMTRRYMISTRYHDVNNYKQCLTECQRANKGHDEFMCLKSVFLAVSYLFIPV